MCLNQVDHVFKPRLVVVVVVVVVVVAYDLPPLFSRSL